MTDKETQQLRERVRKLEKRHGEWKSVFLPVERYCKEQKITAPGESYTTSLVNDHKALTLRVKELEEVNLELAANVEACCELTEMDMGAAIERLLEIDNTESKALLEDFALKQKLEVLEDCIREHAFISHNYNDDMIFASDVSDEIEQLRKGASS